MSKKLEEIRKKIDTLDRTMHKALIERAALIDDILAEKKAKNLPFVQPSREIQMIRDLMGRHEGDLPGPAVVRIWRELLGAAALLQVPLKVSVCVEDDNFISWDLAKSYFGSVVPMQRLSSAMVTLSSVREDESDFAVLPWPKDEDEFPWWPSLFDTDSDLNIMCALPYGAMEGEITDIRDKALIVSKTEFADSSDDHSFLILEIDYSVSRARIVDNLQAIGLEPLSITTQKPKHEGGVSLHLIEVNGFVTKDDPKLQSFMQSFEEYSASCKAVGGYPVPLVYHKGSFPEFQEHVLTAPQVEEKKRV